MFPRKVAAFCIGVTLYGGGCVFIVLLASFVENIVGYAGYHGVSYTYTFLSGKKERKIWDTSPTITKVSIFLYNYLKIKYCTNT